MSCSPILPEGIDIATILREKGPVVKCVLLKSSGGSDDSKKKKAANKDDDTTTTTETTKRVVLVDQMEEIEIDTTPKKQMVQQVLGGAFTFCGQYEDEGIVLMARKEDENLPINPHMLQPPLEEHEIRGDILIMKVAATEEELDDNDEEKKDVIVPTNDEFFLDYTKAEFVAFSARTDVVAPVQPPEEEEEEESESEADDDDDEEYNVLEDDDDEPDEDEKSGLLNLLMGTILRKFAEDNGRGPNTQELLEIRNALASKMGLEMTELPPLDEPEAIVDAEEEGSNLTRRREDDDDDNVEEVMPVAKKVKFGNEESSGSPTGVMDKEQEVKSATE